MKNAELNINWPVGKFTLENLCDINPHYNPLTVRGKLITDLSKGDSSDVVMLAETLQTEGKGRKPSLYILRSKVGKLATRQLGEKAPKAPKASKPNTKAPKAPKASKPNTKAPKAPKADISKVKEQSKKILVNGMEILKELSQALKNLRALAIGKDLTARKAKVAKAPKAKETPAPKSKATKVKVVKVPKVKDVAPPTPMDAVSDQTKAYEQLKASLTAPVNPLPPNPEPEQTPSEVPPIPTDSAPA